MADEQSSLIEALGGAIERARVGRKRVRPVKFLGTNDDGTAYAEVCEPGEADAWAVYEVDADGLEQWVSDHETRDEADAQICTCRPLGGQHVGGCPARRPIVAPAVSLVEEARRKRLMATLDVLDRYFPDATSGERIAAATELLEVR